MIIVKKVEDLSPIQYRACYLANYGPEGYMREELDLARHDPTEREAIAILIWDGPEDKITSLKGWALLTTVRTWGLVGGTRHTKKVSKYSAQFWVKRQYRHKGYGKLLMSEVKKFDKRPHVFPHCSISGEFFSSYDVTIMNDDKHWMKNKPKVG